MQCGLTRSPLLFKRLKLTVLVAVDGFEGEGKVGHDLFLDGQLLAQPPVLSLELLDVAQHAARCAQHTSKQEAKHPPAAPSALSLIVLPAPQRHQVVVKQKYTAQ